MFFAILQRSGTCDGWARGERCVAGRIGANRAGGKSKVYRASPPERIPHILACEDEQGDARVRRLSRCRRKYAAPLYENEDQCSSVAEIGSRSGFWTAGIPGRLLRSFLSE